jgi:hypothetical protein
LFWLHPGHPLANAFVRLASTQRTPGLGSGTLGKPCCQPDLAKRRDALRGFHAERRPVFTKCPMYKGFNHRQGEKTEKRSASQDTHSRAVGSAAALADPIALRRRAAGERLGERRARGNDGDDGGAELHDDAASNLRCTRNTVSACHLPPVGVTMLRAFSSAAIARDDLPASSTKIGRSASARALASSRLRMPLAFRPPSLTPWAFLAASGERTPID